MWFAQNVRARLRFTPLISVTPFSRQSTRLVAMLAIIATSAAQVPGPRLTVPDVERVTGRTGVRLMAPPTAAPDRLSFADANGLVLVVVDFFDLTEFRRAQTMKADTATGPMPVWHASVAGIGDEAFDSPAVGPHLALYARKGPNAFRVLSMLVDPPASSPKAQLSPLQLRRLANIIAGRM